jgi:phosphatidylethanolamine/phosphatidyl-N-methylethanolamine N-methyltransferase
VVRTGKAARCVAQTRRAATPLSLVKMLGDEALFFRTWATNPLKLGAVSPSSRALARLMVEHARPDPQGYTLELGPGTGVATQALIDYGVPAERIVAVEHNRDFCRLLRKRFPDLTVVNGDAFDLDTALAAFADVRFSAALSGLPLLSFPKQLRLKCIDGVLDRMLPGRGIVQFSYGLYPAVQAMPGRIAVAKSKWVLMNLPPARVWTYRRAENTMTPDSHP